MRTLLFLTLSAVLCLSQSLSAQSGDSHPTDANAEFIAADTVRYHLPTAGDPPILSTEVDEGSRHIVYIWRTGNGRLDFVIVAPSFDADDSSGGVVDQLTTPAVFAKMSYASVRRGIALGHADTSFDSLSPTTSRIYVVACVHRLGTGSTTTFVNSSTSWSTRDASYFKRSSGGFVISLSSHAPTTNCSSNSEATVDGESESQFE